MDEKTREKLVRQVDETIRRYPRIRGPRTLRTAIRDVAPNLAGFVASADPALKERWSALIAAERGRTPKGKA